MTATSTPTSNPQAFVTVPGNRHSGVARTLADYENFLILLGSVFVPMSAVLIIDFAALSKGRWDLSPHARTRWPMLLPWAAGFVTYQLINPGYISWWVSAWGWVAARIGFTPAAWMSASILSFAVAAVVALLAGLTPGLFTHRGPHAAAQTLGGPA